MQLLASPCARAAPALRRRVAAAAQRRVSSAAAPPPRAAAAAGDASASAPDTAVAASFRALLRCGAALDGAGGGSDAAAAASPLEVGPSRRALKALSAARPTLLTSGSAAPPPALLSALGAAGAALADPATTPLPWVGSPEPSDGLAASSRRLTDAFVHGVRSPPPRALDAGVVLLAFALAPQAALPADAEAVALAALAALRAALGDGDAMKQAAALATSASAAIRRLLATPPALSAAAERAAEQARFAALGAEKAERAAANAESAATRRLARGDWRCALCGTLNFPDRRVCYACLQPPAGAEEAREGGGRAGVATREAGSQPRTPAAKSNKAAAAERQRRRAGDATGGGAARGGGRGSRDDA
jgi:hypothetical protein